LFCESGVYKVDVDILSRRRVEKMSSVPVVVVPLQVQTNNSVNNGRRNNKDQPCKVRVTSKSVQLYLRY
jgi:hypothetical protein